MSGRYKTRQELQDEVAALQKQIEDLREEISRDRHAKASSISSEAPEDSFERANLAAWEAALDALPVPAMLVSRDLKIEWMNRAMATLWGIDPSDAIGRPCYRIVHSQDAPPDWCPHARTLAEGLPLSAIAHDRRLNRTLAFQTSVRRDAQGGILGSMHVIVDLPEQELTDRVPAEGEEKFLLEAMNQGFGIQDANGIITYVNEKLSAMWGYTRDEVLGRPVADFLDDANKKALQEQLGLRRTGEVSPYELEWIGKGGRRIPTLMSPTPLVSREGTYEGSFAVITDLSGLKGAVSNLKQSEERYKNLVDLSPNGIHVHVEGRIVFANPAMASLLGLSGPEEMIGTRILDFVHPDFHDVVRERIETVTRMAVPVPLIEEKYIRADGSILDVEVAAAPLLYRGQPACQAVVRDIGDRKLAEQQTRSSLKEKEILLREIHHRVKNNLQMISSLLKLESRYMGDKTMADVLEESQVRIASMALVHEALYQSKNLASVDVKSYVEKLVNHLFLSFGASRNKIRVSLETRNVEIPLDKAVPCGLIINELVSNCLKHAFAGRPRGKINISLQAEPRWFVVVVADDGVGLPAGVSVDEPQTMGLRLVQLLARQLLGELKVTSGSEGTSFRVRCRRRGMPGPQ